MFVILKNKKVVKCLFVVLIFVLGWGLIKGAMKIYSGQKYKEMHAITKEYLESKYFENMIIEKGYSYYDNVYTLHAYPEGYEELRFYINVSANGLFINDSYLSVHAGDEAKKIIEPIVKQQIEDYINIIVTVSNDNLIKLEEYYRKNGEPMGWGNEDYLSELSSVLISLYKGDDIAKEEKIIQSILQDIVLLEFDILYVNIRIYEKDVENKMSIREYGYQYTDGGYEEDKR